MLQCSCWGQGEGRKKGCSYTSTCSAGYLILPGDTREQSIGKPWLADRDCLWSACVSLQWIVGVVKRHVLLPTWTPVSSEQYTVSLDRSGGECWRTFERSHRMYRHLISQEKLSWERKHSERTPFLKKMILHRKAAPLSNRQSPTHPSPYPPPSYTKNFSVWG